MYDDGPRIGNAAQQGLSVRAIEFGDIQVLGVPVEPVKFTGDPVDRYAFQAEAVVPDYRFSFPAGQWSSANIMQT